MYTNKQPSAEQLTNLSSTYITAPALPGGFYRREPSQKVSACSWDETIEGVCAFFEITLCRCSFSSAPIEVQIGDTALLVTRTSSDSVGVRSPTTSRRPSYRRQVVPSSVNLFPYAVIDGKTATPVDSRSHRRDSQSRSRGVSIARLTTVEFRRRRPSESSAASRRHRWYSSGSAEVSRSSERSARRHDVAGREFFGNHHRCRIRRIRILIIVPGLCWCLVSNALSHCRRHGVALRRRRHIDTRGHCRLSRKWNCSFLRYIYIYIYILTWSVVMTLNCFEWCSWLARSTTSYSALKVSCGKPWNGNETCWKSVPLCSVDEFNDCVQMFGAVNNLAISVNGTQTNPETAYLQRKPNYTKPSGRLRIYWYLNKTNLFWELVSLLQKMHWFCMIVHHASRDNARHQWLITGYFTHSFLNVAAATGQLTIASESVYE